MRVRYSRYFKCICIYIYMYSCIYITKKEFPSVVNYSWCIWSRGTQDEQKRYITLGKPNSFVNHLQPKTVPVTWPSTRKAESTRGSPADASTSSLTGIRFAALLNTCKKEHGRVDGKWTLEKLVQSAEKRVEQLARSQDDSQWPKYDGASHHSSPNSNTGSYQVFWKLSRVIIR